MLWFASLTANVSMWMSDVTAAWLMTELTHSPAMVALVQTAATLPVFLLGVPSGALADITDRRRFLIGTQVWIALTALAFGVGALTDRLSPMLLLALTFANGIGLAMRWPVLSALIPETLPRAQLPAGLALSAVAMNLSRIVAPMFAGALIATIGPSYVFALNCALALAVSLILLRWRRDRKVSALPAERFFGAIRVGLQYVRQSPPMHAALTRVATYFVFAVALSALLPIEARRFGNDARMFALMLSTMGLGSVCAALALPRLRKRTSRDDLVRWGTWMHAVSTAGFAVAPHWSLALIALYFAGVAWITVANSLTVAAQMALPDWVKARGMSIYQMALMGGAGFGAALWGQVAKITEPRTALLCAAGSALIGLFFTRHLSVGSRNEEDLTPARLWREPEVAIPIQPDEGPVMVQIEYRIDPARADEFAAVMRETRRSRLRNGAISWELFRDTTDPGRFVEYFIDESWVDHLRRQDRLTAADVALRNRRLAFQVNSAEPIVSRYIAAPVRGD